MFFFAASTGLTVLSQAAAIVQAYGGAAAFAVAAHACSLAGALFDRSGSYASTVWVAAGINVLEMLVAGRLPAR